jgi:hypothetical protein
MAASASNADLAGLRTALPNRSARISTTATARPAAPSSGVIANNGTHTAVNAYPATVNAQYRRLRSASGPDTSRPTNAVASPAPVTHPTSTAEPPRDASSGPYTERPPSYTMSAARLTIPKPTTIRHDDQSPPRTPADR